MADITKNRIAIVSENKDIADFFLLEAICCDCSAQVFSSFPNDTLSFDIVIYDSALGACASDGFDCKIITVITDEDGNEKSTHLQSTDAVWEWPVSVRTVREAYLGYGSAETENVKAKEPVIYILSESKRKLLYLNQQISLTDSEWRILMLLDESGGEPLSREVLNSCLGDRGGNLADVHICNLRKKLEVPHGRRLIVNMRNKGYFLNTKIKRFDA